MPLNDLTLNELTELAGNLNLLQEVGCAFVTAGLEPSFDLTPGQRTSISFPGMMPAVAAAHAATHHTDQVSNEDDSADEGIAMLAQELVPLASHPETAAAHLTEESRRIIAQLQTPSTEAAPTPTRAPEPVDPPPAAEGPVGGDPIASAPEQSVTGQPETIPPAASPQNDPEPVARAAEASGGGTGYSSGSTPPAATHQASFGQTMWSEEEDHLLVSLVVAGVVGLGLTKTAAIGAAARELGRPEAGTAFRAHHKLKDRLAAATAEAVKAKEEAKALLTQFPPGARQDAPPPQAEVQGKSAEPSKGDAPAPVPDPGAGAPVKAWNNPEHVADPIAAHIMTLPTKGGWTLERDLELMELSIEGWQPNEIALQLKIQSSLIKPRFDLLTGLYEDADGKKVRRFKREDVLAALKSLTAGKAA